MYLLRLKLGTKADLISPAQFNFDLAATPLHTRVSTPSGISYLGLNLSASSSQSSFKSTASPFHLPRFRTVSGVATEAAEAPKNYVGFEEEQGVVRDLLKHKGHLVGAFISSRRFLKLYSSSIIYNLPALRSYSLTCYFWYIAVISHLHPSSSSPTPPTPGIPMAQSYPAHVQARFTSLLPNLRIHTLFENVSTNWFDSCILCQLLTLTNDRELEIINFYIPSFTPIIRRHFRPFLPTLQFLHLKRPQGPDPHYILRGVVPATGGSRSSSPDPGGGRGADAYSSLCPSTVGMTHGLVSHKGRLLSIHGQFVRGFRTMGPFHANEISFCVACLREDDMDATIAQN